MLLGIDDTRFFCFTTSTSEKLMQSRYLADQITPLIPKGSECLRKSCVVHCGELIAFDDILLSNYLRGKRVTIEGKLTDEHLKWIARVVKGSKVLSEREKNIVGRALVQFWVEDE
jgi:hypothetical protein